MAITVKAEPTARAQRAIQNVLVPMRDSVRLSADVYLPPQPEPAPVLLQRTPYGKQRTGPTIERARQYADHGYAVVVQDVRGRWESEGEFYPHRNEGRDGFDTIEWLAEQPWCDGSVGMYGGSYTGWVQWAAARERPPSLRTLVSTAPSGRWFEEVVYSHGIFDLQHLQWLNLVGGRTNQDNSLIDWSSTFEQLPLRSLDEAINRPSQVWQDWLDHPTLDTYWRELRLDHDFAAIDLPALHITGWYDGDQPGALFFYHGMVGSSPAAPGNTSWSAPGITPGRHCREPSSAFSTSARAHSSISPRSTSAGSTSTSRGSRSSRCHRFAISSSGPTNGERTSPGPHLGPSPRCTSRTTTVTRNSQPASASRCRTGTSTTRRIQFASQTTSTVTTSCEACEPPTGADLERSELEARADVLVYETPPLEHELVIAGRGWVDLHAESDCVDTDWFVWLADHRPDGRSILLAQGRLGARSETDWRTPNFSSPARCTGTGSSSRGRLRVFTRTPRRPSGDEQLLPSLRAQP